jgi:hypothetical protein
LLELLLNYKNDFGMHSIVLQSDDDDDDGKDDDKNEEEAEKANHALFHL